MLGVLLALASTGSMVIHSEVAGRSEVEGTGCGVAATKDVPLPATNVSGVVVRRPKVGAKSDDSQITAVAVLGTTIRLTAVGAGPAVCDPEEDPDIPPEQRPWKGLYDVAAGYDERVSAGSWTGVLHAKVFHKPPKRVTIPERASALRVRWRSFGGPTATGYGTLRNVPPPHVHCNHRTCVGEGDRVKVVLSRPSRCYDTGQTVYYGRITFYATRRYPLLYPIRKGDVLIGGTPQCSYAPKRVKPA